MLCYKILVHISPFLILFDELIFLFYLTEKILERGERIELLMEKADLLQSKQMVFKKPSKSWIPSFNILPSRRDSSWKESTPPPSLDKKQLPLSNNESINKPQKINRTQQEEQKQEEQSQQQEEQQKEEQKEDQEDEAGHKRIEDEIINKNFDARADEYDITLIPKKLDSAFEKYDFDNAAHSATIKIVPHWKKESKSLLDYTKTFELNKEELKNEKLIAFDLLDAFSKSGDLTLSDVSVHVLVGVCHWFDYDVMESIVHENINPVKKLETTGLIVASSILNVPTEDLISSHS